MIIVIEDKFVGNRMGVRPYLTYESMPDLKAGFDNALKQAGNKLVVVDFTATWCGPCQMIAPIFKRMSEDYKNVVFLKVDVDDAQDVSTFCDVKCMPTFQFYKNGQKIDEFSGANKDTLEEKIKNHQ